MSSPTFDELRREGVRALRKGDYSAAGALFERAARCATSDAEKTRAIICAASVAVFSGEPSELIHELPKIVLSRDDAWNVWLSAYHYGNYLVDHNKRAVATKYLTIMFEQLPALDPKQPYAALSFDFACALALAERKFGDACRFAMRAREAVALCDPSEDTASAAAVIEHNLGYALLGDGKPVQAIPHLQAGFEALEALGTADRDRAEIHVNLAFAHLLIDHLEEAQAHLDLLERHIDAASEWLRPYLLYLRAEVAQRRGEEEPAERYYEQLQEHDPRLRGLSKVLSRVSLLPIMLPERY